jgi:transposase-like protein
MYGAVDPRTNEFIQFNLFTTTKKQTTRWFFDELHRCYQLNDVLFLVNDPDYLGPVLTENESRFQVISYGSRNAIERVSSRA